MPRCKQCKDKFDANYFNQKYCMVKDECIKAHVEVAKNTEWKKRQKNMDVEVNTQKYRSYLNDEIQKLARLIDAKCGIETCIDCGISFGKQTDGGHYHSKGANASISWNLHNIHSQASHCNRNGLGGGKALGYYEGLQSRYSKEYADYVRYDLVRLYPSIHISNKEVNEKLKIVRKLIREIDTFKFSDPIKAREMFNNLIGIYKKV